MGVGARGGSKRSLILGGGALGGGPIFPRMVSCLDSGRARRSGELPPWLRFERGARAGILEGDLPPALDTDSARGLRLNVPPAVGVLAPVLGGGAFILLTLLSGAAAFEFFAALGGGPAGVFDRGPGAVFASEASNSSRYLSP